MGDFHPLETAGERTGAQGVEKLRLKLKLNHKEHKEGTRDTKN